MSDFPSRRATIKAFGAGTVGFGLGSGIPGWLAAQERAAGDSQRIAAAEPFDLRDVRLLDGPFRDAQQRNGAYILSLDLDRLLHNFRINAACRPKRRSTEVGNRRIRGSTSVAMATRWDTGSPRLH